MRKIENVSEKKNEEEQPLWAQLAVIINGSAHLTYRLFQQI